MGLNIQQFLDRQRQTEEQVNTLANEVSAGTALTPEQRNALIDYTYRSWGTDPNETGFGRITLLRNPDLQGLESVGDAELVARANRGFQRTNTSGSFLSDLVSFYGPWVAGGLVGGGAYTAYAASAPAAAASGSVVGGATPATATEIGGAATSAQQVLSNSGEDTGAFDQYGSQNTPGAASQTTVFNNTPNGLGGAAATAGTALERIANGTATAADWLSVGGNVGGAALGYLGAERQGERMDALARDYMAFGAPSRARFEESFAPGFNVANLPGVQESIDTSTEAMLRKLSTQGNPYGNPGGLAEMQKYIVGNVALPQLNEYRRLNAGAGGLASLTAAAPNVAVGGINADAGRFDAIGGALADLTRPKRDIYDYLRDYRSLG